MQKVYVIITGQEKPLTLAIRPNTVQWSIHTYKKTYKIWAKMKEYTITQRPKHLDFEETKICNI